MGWPPEDLVLPSRLCDCILSKRCVAYVGAGASSGCYPNWHELINSLCQNCGSHLRVTVDSPVEDYLAAAEDAKAFNSDSYHQYLGHVFGRPATQTHLIYSALLSLPFKSYITSNFDPLLALQARHFGCRSPAEAYPNLDRAQINSRSIYYVHGMIHENRVPAPGTIVLARSEFEEAYTPNSNLMNFLIPTFENDAVCFVGCRLQEPALTGAFRICKEHQRKRMIAAASMGQPVTRPPDRFILLARPEIFNAGVFDRSLSETAMAEQHAYYQGFDIEAIWYTAHGDHATLRRALEQLANLPPVSPNYGWT